MSKIPLQRFKAAHIRKLFALERERQGYSLRDMEKLIGVAFSTLARFERAEHQPTSDTLIRINAWLADGPQLPKKERKVSARKQIMARLDRIEKHLGIENEEC